MMCVYLYVRVLVVKVKVIPFIRICVQVKEELGVLPHERHKLDKRMDKISDAYIRTYIHACIHIRSAFVMAEVVGVQC